MVKRLFDVTFSAIGLCVLLLPSVFIAILVRSTSPGPVFHWSSRVGRHNELFKMPKFRSMNVETHQVATHLLNDPEQYLTSLGSFLRKSSMDEIPQLLSILTGRMSFVGPRPALFNQYDLIELRTLAGVQRLRPGLTGWAQINGRDTLSVEQKVRYDIEYLENHSFLFDLRILFLTIIRIFYQREIKH